MLIRSCGSSTRSFLSDGEFCLILLYFSRSVRMDVSAHFSADWTSMWTLIKRVDAGKVLHSFCPAENPWSVLDPTVNLVSPVGELEFSSAAHSRNADTIPHSTLCACKSGHWRRRRRVEIWTENVSVRNLTLMNRLAVALSASDVGSAQCTFSHTLVRHLAPTARTTAEKCSGASTVVSSRASNAAKAAPATAMSGSACDPHPPTTTTRRLHSSVTARARFLSG